MPPRFEWPVRVYWEDTDGGGIVYHAAYLAYLERARTEWLRSLGVDQGALRAGEHVQFAVVDMTVRWLRPARFDDQLTVVASLVGRGGASVGFAQAVLRGPELLLDANVRVAAIDSRTLRPRRLPVAFAARLDAQQGIRAE